MTENNNEQPLDFGMNAEPEPKPLQVTDMVAKRWFTVSLWLRIAGGMLFFDAILLLGFMVKSGDEGVLFLLMVLTFFGALFFWSAGTNIRNGLNFRETETVQTGFKMLLWNYQYLGSIVLMLCLLAIFLFIVN